MDKLIKIGEVYINPALISSVSFDSDEALPKLLIWTSGDAPYKFFGYEAIKGWTKLHGFFQIEEE